MEECLSFLKGFLEEIILSKKTACIEIHTKKELPQDIQNIYDNQTS